MQFLLTDENQAVKVEPTPSSLIGERVDVHSFSGVAHSGKPFKQHGQDFVIDFDGISFKDPVPVLLEHDHDKIIGYGNLKMDNGVLTVSGFFLSNQDAASVYQNAKDGFPWQLSIDARPQYVEEVKTGESVTVNGVEYQGAVSVLRKVTIKEVSFTAIGADDGAEVTVLSDKPSQPTDASGEEKEIIDFKEALNEIKALKAEVASLKQENATLEKQLEELAKSNNQAQTDALLSDAGFTKKDGKFNGVSDATYSVLLSLDVKDRIALIDDMKKPAVPDYLLSDQGASIQGQPENVLLKDIEARNKEAAYV